MKLRSGLSVFAALAAICAGSLSGCVPSTATDNTVITLNTSPRSISLAKITDSIPSQATLSCGCAFRPRISSFTGDTNVIRWSSPDLDSLLSAHQIYFKAVKTATTGTYKTKTVVFYHDDHNNDLTDTITTTLTLP